MPRLHLCASRRAHHVLAATLVTLVAALTVALSGPSAASARTAPTSFNLATFNILGSQHTAGSARYASGSTRARWAARLLLERHVDVVGFQEIQPDQLRAAWHGFRGRYGVYPGKRLGYQGVPQSLFWNKAYWTLMKARTITIPFLGQHRIQPAVRLRSTTTGRQIWFVNVHNAPRGRQAERDVAIQIEAALVRQLGRSGKPVFLVGDLNEKDAAFCGLTGTTTLTSPAGGSNDGGWCLPPAGMRIDWIFGTRTSFSGYLVDKSPAVSRITDHAVLFTRATLR